MDPKRFIYINRKIVVTQNAVIFIIFVNKRISYADFRYFNLAIRTNNDELCVQFSSTFEKPKQFNLFKTKKNLKCFENYATYRKS